MRVLVISNMYPGRDPGFIYAGIFVKEQVDSLRKIPGVECDVFIIEGFKSKYLYLLAAIKLCLVLSFKHYDVVHVHYGLSGLFMLINPFRKLWKNVIITLHGGDILLGQGKYVQVMLTKMVIRKAGYVITLNDKMSAVVAKIRSDFYVLPCGVDGTLFNACYSNSRKNIILFPGRIDRKVKNYPLFEKIIREYEQEFGKIKVVEIDGYSRAEVSKLMCNAKALLMTSISEGSPQVVKEAMLCDLPVVSADIGDVRCVLGNTKGTAVFDHDDDLSEVAKLIHHSIVIAEQSPGQRRARVIELGLEQDQVVEKLLQLYEKVVKSA